MWQEHMLEHVPRKTEGIRSPCDPCFQEHLSTGGRPVTIYFATLGNLLSCGVIKKTRKCPGNSTLNTQDFVLFSFALIISQPRSLVTGCVRVSV